MTKPFTILEAMDNPKLWGREWFPDPTEWTAWRAFLKALFGLPMSEADLDVFRACTGRGTPHSTGFTEAWLVVGRRGGKSTILATIAVYLAVFRDWQQYLTPGEKGTIKVIACDRKQAKIIFSHCTALLCEVPVLKEMVKSVGDDEIVLTNRIVIEIQTASFRTVRGYTIVAALLDEIAYWRTDEASTNPDSEIVSAIRPAMLTVPGAMLLAASNPYAKRGTLWDAFRSYHGRDDADVLVWHASTRTMHPGVSQAVIDKHIELDPDKYGAEYNALFRTDIESYISGDAVEALIQYGRRELPPSPRIQYAAGVDVSGGASDSYCWSIGHLAEDTVVVDLLREVRPPFSPAAVTAQVAADLARYNVSSIVGDYFGAEWVGERFREAGITYNRSERPKSLVYIELLPLLMSSRVELLDHPRCNHQLASLERRHHRGGKDTVDHPPSGSDDLVNSMAVMAVSLSAAAMPALWQPSNFKVVTMPWEVVAP